MTNEILWILCLIAIIILVCALLDKNDKIKFLEWQVNEDRRVINHQEEQIEVLRNNKKPVRPILTHIYTVVE